MRKDTGVAHKKTRGMALPTALLVLVVLTLLGMAAIFTASTELDIAGNGRRELEALSIAEGGVHEGLARLNMPTGAAPIRIIPGETSPGVPDPDWSMTIVNKSAPGAGEVQTLTGTFGSSTVLPFSTVVRYKLEQAGEAPTHCDADGCNGEVVLFHTNFGYASASVPTGTSPGRPVVQIESTYTGTGPGAAQKTVLVEAIRAEGGINATATVRACGYVAMQGNATVNAPAGGTSVMAGTTFSSQGSATVNPPGSTNSGQSCPGDLFAQTFGMPAAEMQALADMVQSGPANTPPSGTKGKTIYITGAGTETSWQGNAIIGTPEEPVTVIVEGHLRIQGNVRFFGFVYTRGDFDIQGNAQLEGAVITEGNARDLQGNSVMTFNPAALTNPKLNGPFAMTLWKVN